MSASESSDGRNLLVMPYPDNLVQEGETVALDLRPHWWYFSRNILTGIPLFIILMLVFQIEDNTVKTGSRWICARTGGTSPATSSPGSRSSSS